MEALRDDSPFQGQHPAESSQDMSQSSSTLLYAEQQIVPLTQPAFSQSFSSVDSPSDGGDARFQPSRTVLSWVARSPASNKSFSQESLPRHHGGVPTRTLFGDEEESSSISADDESSERVQDDGYAMAGKHYDVDSGLHVTTEVVSGTDSDVSPCGSGILPETRLQDGYSLAGKEHDGERVATDDVSSPDSSHWTNVSGLFEGAMEVKGQESTQKLLSSNEKRRVLRSSSNRVSPLASMRSPNGIKDMSFINRQMVLIEREGDLTTKAAEDECNGNEENTAPVAVSLSKRRLKQVAPRHPRERRAVTTGISPERSTRRKKRAKASVSSNNEKPKDETVDETVENPSQCTNRCVPYKGPVQSTQNDTTIPEFSSLVNYPGYQRETNKNGRRHCLMCGQRRPIAKRRSQGAVLITGYRGVCTKCCGTIWTHSETNTLIKMCTICRKFLPCGDFGEKGALRSCAACRIRAMQYAKRN